MTPVASTYPRPNRFISPPYFEQGRGYLFDATALVVYERQSLEPSERDAVKLVLLFDPGESPCMEIA